MANNCQVNASEECLFEVFPTEHAATQSCEVHWASGRKARVVKTSNATALLIRADGTPDPASKVEVSAECFVVYSET
jgi:hypothetical protein